MAANIRVGTSGFAYKHWVGTFYPERLAAKRMLEEYVKSFDTVELNNPFYHLPQRSTFEKWKENTPKDFLFAVKASRFITHVKKLNDPQEPVERLKEAVSGLGRKLGPILFQLPPNFHVNAERLRILLSLLPKRWKCTFEFRDTTWINDDVLGMLREYNCAFCIYELAGFETEHILTADWTYIRLHGPGWKYQGSYSTAKLEEWASELGRWRKKLTDIYVYFDNDQEGYAAYNALTLKDLLGV